MKQPGAPKTLRFYLLFALLHTMSKTWWKATLLLVICFTHFALLDTQVKMFDTYCSLNCILVSSAEGSVSVCAGVAPGSYGGAQGCFRVSSRLFLVECHVTLSSSCHIWSSLWFPATEWHIRVSLLWSEMYYSELTAEPFVQMWLYLVFTAVCIYRQRENITSSAFVFGNWPLYKKCVCMCI